MGASEAGAPYVDIREAGRKLLCGVKVLGDGTEEVSDSLLHLPEVDSECGASIIGVSRDGVHAKDAKPAVQANVRGRVGTLASGGGLRRT